MSRRGFCDSCDQDCGGEVVAVFLTEQHETSQGGLTARDSYRQMEFCRACGERVKAALGLDLSGFLMEPPVYPDFYPPPPFPQVPDGL